VLILDKAIDSVFKKPDSIFIKTTVRDLFFYGIRFNCSVKDFAGSALCSALMKNKEILIQEDNSVYRYGYLAAVRICFNPKIS